MRRVLPRSVLIREGLGLAAVDVVMNLFLFFLIAFALVATFAKKSTETSAANSSPDAGARPPPLERVRPLDLPASTASLGQDPLAVRVDADAQGGLFIEGVPVPREALTESIRAAQAQGARPVVLRAHRGLSLGDTVELLDFIEAGRPPSVSLSTVEKSSP